MANHQNGSIVHFKNILDILVIIAIIHILKNVRSIKYTLIVIYNGRLPLPLIFPILADKYYQTNGGGGGGGVMVLNITFNNILVAVSFIGEGNRNTRRNFCKTLTNQPNRNVKQNEHVETNLL